MTTPISPRAERGFSMFLVIMAMFVTSMFVAAAFAAANGDLPLAGISKDRKATYAAAEAGLNFYLTHLNQDNDYWTKCENVPAPNGSELNPVNRVWNGSGSDPRRWRTVTGSRCCRRTTSPRAIRPIRRRCSTCRPAPSASARPGSRRRRRT
jgi:Tfp pilus assembly protein PilX